jgi:tetratricopeptide (TPR) repeat protein
MTAKLTLPLRETPATVPALAALALFVLWATDQAGYPATHWALGGLIVLVLLGIALGVVGLRVADVPVPVRIAIAAFAAYTALSFLSILWADVPGDAWEGANRTLLYLLVFALFACWRQRGSSAALLLVGWTVALIAIAVFVALYVDAAAGNPRRLERLLPVGRLVYPSGYANANAAQWLMAFWPALLLARSGSLRWYLRGVLAGGAVLLAEVALLSQSRGSIYATPVMLILVFVLLPGRVRTFVLAVPVVIGIAVAAPRVVRVGDRLEHGQNVELALHSAIATMFWAALAVGVLVAAGAAIESRSVLSKAAARRVHRGLGALGIVTLVAVLVGGWVASGDPLARARNAWDTFKSEKGYQANGSGSRLTSGLGSTRYDLYRVALDEFAAHPLVGIGVDNIQQQYLRHGHSHETPRYPHSIEIRTLAETGLVGSLLAIVGLGAALLAGSRGLRPENRSDPLAGAVAAAALAGFGYWVVHGSFDWFWEFAGLGAPGFAMLGLFCALTPRPLSPAQTSGGSTSGTQATDEPFPPDLTRLSARSSGRYALDLRRGGVIVGVIASLAAAASLTTLWLSGLAIDEAGRVWAVVPGKAYADLNDAARLNPLSAEPYLLAGSIALRFRDLARADHEFALALERSPEDAYATLERGAIASARGDRREALILLERAASLNPREMPTHEALRLARGGKRVNIADLNREILLEAQLLL